MSVTKSEVKEYPKILVVNGQAIGQKSGVGSTLANIFKEWPRDRIAQIIPYGVEPDNTICDKNWFLKITKGKQINTVNKKNGKVLKTFQEKAFEYSITPELIQWVKEFKPQLIYSILEIPRITVFVNKLSEELGIKVIPHLMDDWPKSNRGMTLYNFWLYIIRSYHFKKIIKKSPLGLSISDAMSGEFRRRYKLEFYTIMNCGDPAEYSIRKFASDTNVPLRLVYAGSGLGLGRNKTIQSLSLAVQALCKSGFQIELTVLMNRVTGRKKMIDSHGVYFRDSVSELQLTEYLANADIAVIAESFKRNDINYTKWSFSAKLPIYLLAGCYVLAIGPSEINSMKYIQENNLGSAISINSVELIRNTLIKLYSDRRQLFEIQNRNQEFAGIHFTRADIQNKLVELLSSITKTNVD